MAVIGDSTPPVRYDRFIGCRQRKTPITVIISDNESISMTGGQNPRPGKIDRSAGYRVERTHPGIAAGTQNRELCRIIRKNWNTRSIGHHPEVCIRNSRE
ncbi:MAG: thiamine pyrophosphate-dependent enzyme [Odoribacter splanchnicus]